MGIDENSWLVVGAGNIGLAAAVHLSQQKQKVLIYTRREISLSKTRKIFSTDLISPGIHSIGACSSDLQELSEHNKSQLPRKIIIGCRGNDVKDIATKLAPFIHKNMSILMICSSRFAGIVFSKTLKRLGVHNRDIPRIADFKTSPFVSRGNGDNLIKISAFKDKVPIAAQNFEATDYILKDFSQVFGNLLPVKSYCELNFRKCDDIIHIPLLLTGWINVETGKVHNIYRTATEKTTNLIVQLDRERLSVASAFGLKLIDVCASYQESYNTPGPSLLDHFNQVTAYTNATIQNARHRFLFEDVPFGAVPLQSVARLRNVQTPLLDACISFSNHLLNLPEGWNLQSEDFDL